MPMTICTSVAHIRRWNDGTNICADRDYMCKGHSLESTSVPTRSLTTRDKAELASEKNDAMAAIAAQHGPGVQRCEQRLKKHTAHCARPTCSSSVTQRGTDACPNKNDIA